MTVACSVPTKKKTRKRTEYDPGLVGKYIDYNPVDGRMTWKVDRRGKAHKGDLCGTINPDTGLRQIKIFNRSMLASHLAFLIVHERLPHRITHKNGNNSDDSINNIVEVVHSDHASSTKVWGAIPFRGITYDCTHDRYIARLTRHGKRYLIGSSFRTADQAHLAREEFIKSLKEITLNNNKNIKKD